MDIGKAIKVSLQGMRAQAVRLRVLAENIANAESVPDRPGVDPYRRKVVSFANVLDRETGLKLVEVKKIGVAGGEFTKRHDPDHPAADEEGYIRLPNVNPLIEMMDFREAQRSYEANLSAVQVSKRMIQRTIELLRG